MSSQAQEKRVQLARLAVAAAAAAQTLVKIGPCRYAEVQVTVTNPTTGPATVSLHSGDAAAPVAADLVAFGNAIQENGGSLDLEYIAKEGETVFVTSSIVGVVARVMVILHF